MSTSASIANNGIVNSAINQSVNAELMKQISSIIGSKQFNAKNILILLALFGIDTIRTNVNALLGKTMEGLSKYVLKWFRIIKIYIMPTRNIVFENSDNKIDLFNYDMDNGVNRKIEINNQFYGLLCEYILLDPTCMHCKKIDGMEIKEGGYMIFMARSDDIQFKFESHTIKLLHPMSYSYTRDSNGKIMNVMEVNKNNTIRYGFDKRGLAFYLLQKLPINQGQVEFIYSEIGKFIDNNTTSYTVLNYDYKHEDDFMDIMLTVFSNVSIMNEYKNILYNHCSGNDNVMGMMGRYNAYNTAVNRNKVEMLILYAIIIEIIIEFHPNHKLPDDYILFLFQTKLEICKRDELTTIRALCDKIFGQSKIKYAIYEYFNKMTTMHADISSRPSEVARNIRHMYFVSAPTKTEICFVVQDKDSNYVGFDESELLMHRFINYVSSSQSLRKTMRVSIPVFTAVITYKDADDNTTSKVVEKTLEDGTVEKTTTKKTPSETEQSVSITLKTSNNVYKAFDTLYLKKDDEFRLKSILNSFSERKTTYKNLGLPFKFNCLLHGPPGTGKTSVIKAIASHLNKNMYYVDLSKIRTDSVLNQVYEKIYHTFSSGGIIVMEDVDAMSDVVLSRDDDKIREPCTQLTLSNLLNLMDGTMCASESMIIMTTNHIERLDPALIRAGRMDLTIHLDYCDAYQITTIYKNVMNRDLDDGQLERLSRKDITPAQLIYGLLPYLTSDMGDEDIISAVLSAL